MFYIWGDKGISVERYFRNFLNARNQKLGLVTTNQAQTLNKHDLKLFISSALGFLWIMIPSPTTVPLLCKRLVIRGGGGEDRVTMTELLSMAMVDSYFECHSVSFRRPSESGGYTFTNLQTIWRFQPLCKHYITLQTYMKLIQQELLWHLLAECEEGGRDGLFACWCCNMPRSLEIPTSRKTWGVRGVSRVKLCFLYLVPWLKPRHVWRPGLHAGKLTQ